MAPIKESDHSNESDSLIRATFWKKFNISCFYYSIENASDL